MRFVNLGVFAELEAVVFDVIDGKAGDNLAWAEVASDSW